MSAIFGVLHWDDQPVESRLLESLGRLLPHHSEAASKTWVVAQSGLGCNYFPTTPEAISETLPYVHAETGIVITADARLDDREELVAALGLSLSSDRVWPDSALIAEAYLKWGAECPEHLTGDFAFGVWNPRQKSLFAARDHFGVKPFYYVAEERRFAFASEPRALLSLPGVNQAIDRVTVAGYLADIYDNSSGTAFQAVRRLCASESALVSPGKCQITRYYEPSPERTTGRHSDAEYAEAFRELFFKAVRRRLRSVGPVGCMLSGGLDSSAVACVAAQTVNEQPGARLELFSLVYPEQPKCDESRYIQAVVKQTRLPWHAVPRDNHRSIRDIRRLAEQIQEPNLPCAAFANGSVCAAAADRGMSVILDGHGGDETVSLGIEWLQELLDEGHLLRFSYECYLLMREDPDVRAGPDLLRYLSNLGLAGRIKRRLQRSFTLRRDPPSTVKKEPLWPYLSDELIREGALIERDRMMKTAQIKAYAQKHWHHYMMTQSDQARGFEGLGRMVGPRLLERRYPLWDKDLVEFCLSLPSDLKLRHGYTRWIMRTSLRSALPAEVRGRRDKTDFTPQVVACLNSLGEKACKAKLQSDNPLASELLHANWLSDALGRCFKPGGMTGKDQRALWQGLSLTVWLETLSNF